MCSEFSAPLGGVHLERRQDRVRAVGDPKPDPRLAAARARQRCRVVSATKHADVRIAVEAGQVQGILLVDPVPGGGCRSAYVLR